MASSLSTWLRGLKSGLLGPRQNFPRAVSRPARAPRLGMESLEDRTVPNTHTWDDGGATNNWSEGANWDIGFAPSDGDDVIYQTSDASTIQNIGGLTLATLRFNAGSDVTVTLGENLEINGSILGSNITDATGLNDINGPADLILVNDTVLIQTTAATGRLRIAADITGTEGLFKFGAGTLELAGSNTFAGTTTISAGTLNVTGSVSGPVSVTGGTLAGNGTVGPVTATGGTVAPGMGASAQTLSTGNLNLATTFAPVISGTGSDRLNVTGTVDLNGATLNPTVIGGDLPATGTYTLISNDGSDAVAGAFTGLAQGAIMTVGGQTFVLSYTGGDGNDVTLTPPVYSNALMFGDFLILTGAGFPGGFTFVQMPAGTQALYADITGDGWGDVILLLPNLALAVDGATGRFVLLSADLSGDGVRDLQIFNPDGTTTTIDGVTGMVV